MIFRQERPPISTRVLQLDPSRIDATAIAEAAAFLCSGGLVAFPTETVYGLGANALDAKAVARVYEAKGRPGRNPIIVHVPDISSAQSLVTCWPQVAQRLAARFWPGPLTLVLPKSQLVPDVVTGGGLNVGLRVPAQPIAQALLRAANVPVAAPSANRSTYISPTTAQHVLRGLDGRIDCLLDGGPTSAGIESTVLDLTSNPARVLRPGPVSIEEVRACAGCTVMEASPIATADVPLQSPGMMARHYAPKATLLIAKDDGQDEVRQLSGNGQRVGWLTFASPSLNPAPDTDVIVMPARAQAYAARLYIVLHELDEAKVDWIVVARVPDSPEWTAVRDRLARAATA